MWKMLCARVWVCACVWGFFSAVYDERWMWEKAPKKINSNYATIISMMYDGDYDDSGNEEYDFNDELTAKENTNFISYKREMKRAPKRATTVCAKLSSMQWKWIFSTGYGFVLSSLLIVIFLLAVVVIGLLLTVMLLLPASRTACLPATVICSRLYGLPLLFLILVLLA